MGRSAKQEAEPVTDRKSPQRSPRMVLASALARAGNQWEKLDARVALLDADLAMMRAARDAAYVKMRKAEADLRALSGADAKPAGTGAEDVAR